MELGGNGEAAGGNGGPESGGATQGTQGTQKDTSQVRIGGVWHLAAVETRNKWEVFTEKEDEEEKEEEEEDKEEVEAKEKRKEEGRKEE